MAARRSMRTLGRQKTYEVCMSTCIVIHGTWGTRSDFGFADSLFCRAIKAAIQRDIEFKRFEWSGSNSSIERTKAANRLRVLIKELSSRGTPVFIIAHSHGGTIAVEALQDKEAAQYIGGLITLGTPFLSTEVRKWVSFLATLPGRMSVYAILTGSLVASIIAVVGSSIGMFHFAFGVLGAVAILAIIVLATKSKSSDLLEQIASSAEAAASNLSSPVRVPLSANLLVITSSADEALWWLKRVISFTNLPFALFDIGLWVLGWSTIVAIGLGVLFRVMSLFLNDIDWLLVPMCVSMGLGLALAVLGILAIALVKLIHRVVGTGSAGSLWTEIVVRTKATRLPNLTCNSLEEIHVPIANIHGGLWHSKYTRSGAVVDQIARKIGDWHNLPSYARSEIKPAARLPAA
jgi:hypothetical protein